MTLAESSSNPNQIGRILTKTLRALEVMDRTLVLMANNEKFPDGRAPAEAARDVLDSEEVRVLSRI